MRSILENLSTEKLILHKPSGSTCEVEGMIESSGIQSDDVTVPIVHKTKDDNSLPHMIFISHSTKDKEYTKAFVELLFGIGLKEDDIVCSSYPGLGVPFRASVYEWLVEKFQKYDLHVFYFLSRNYYKSAASLNEMGAAWALKQKWDGILLPGFSFTEIAGCIDPSQIGIKLDGDIDELKYRLGELKDSIVDEFGLQPISATRWEEIRNKFVDIIPKIVPNAEHLQDVEHTTTLDVIREKKLQYLTKKTEFANLLYQTGNKYCASNFFANLFWCTEDEYSNIDSIIKAERKYIQCCSFYENNEKRNANRLARELVSEYKDLMSKPPYTICAENDIMKNFVKMRMSDALFYKNMTVDNPNEFIMNEAEKSIQYYQEIIDHPSEINVWDEEILAYFYNSQGYTSYYMSRNVAAGKSEVRDQYLNKALGKLKAAVENTPNKGRYRRNLGLVYQAQNDLDKAHKTYEEAVENDPLDCKAYNTVVALDLKDIDREFGINDRDEKLLNEMTFDDENHKWKKILDKDITLCRTAEKISFSLVDTHYNMAKAYLYKYLFEGKTNAGLLEQAHEQIDIAKGLNPKSIGTLYTRRNIYEAEGNFQKAFECANEELIKERGDNPKLLARYGERLKKLPVVRIY